VSTSLFVSEDGSTTLEGTLDHVIYASPDTGWTVARLDAQGQPATIVGNLAGVQPGESLRLTGRWVDDRKYGRQFRVESFLNIQPTTLLGIERYLGSGLVRGIGPVMARKLVDHFKLDTLHVIDTEATRLREVPGLGRVRIAAIQAAWKEQRGIRDVMVFLQSHGVSATHAARIYKRYGSNALGVVRENPYRLAREVAGIGFLSADRIAAALGTAPDAPQRLEAGVLYALEQAADEGHSYVPCDKLGTAAAALLECEPTAALAAIDRLALRGDAVVEDAVDERPVYDAYAYETEVAAARGVRRLLAARRAAVSRVDPALEAFEATAGIQLAPEQRRAVVRALEAPVLVVTGGPGTGKTTLVHAILYALDRRRERALLCAPTGRAAKRLAETTGRPAQTIHRLLEWNPREHRFLRDAEAPLEADLVVVDEASMVDVALFRHLLAALPDRARLVLVGDADQLPSVGPGAVLADCLAAGTLDVVRLQHIYRQEDAGRIVVNAHRIRDGEAPFLPPAGARSDFVLVERSEPEDVLATLRLLVAERLPAALGVDPRADIQVLVPMHRGTLGAAALNAALQEVLNPRGAPIGTTGLRVGDKVMQVRNNYDLEVFNGDLGLVEAWDADERVLHARFDERSVRYEPSDLTELVPAYACTVHKSQGSEYPVVVVVLHRQHHVMLRRNLLYTAVTRARRQVVLLGERRALYTALADARVQSRWTRLAARLQDSNV
jgi:exodeoxyribonuclease V alpha subunit